MLILSVCGGKHLPPGATLVEGKGRCGGIGHCQSEQHLVHVCLNHFRIVILDAGGVAGAVSQCRGWRLSDLPQGEDSGWSSTGLRGKCHANVVLAQSRFILNRNDFGSAGMGLTLSPGYH